uniref:Condensin complex subunit 2 n=2 Tax=Lygus hesperus TaxID=30085 RepID=A0A0A9YMD0_LYGHE
MILAQKMSKSKRRNVKVHNDPFGDDEGSFDGFANTDTDLDSLVQEALGTPGKPKKLSILLSKEQEDFFGDEENDDEEEKERQRQREKDLAEQQEKEKQAALQSKEPVSAFGVLTNLNPQELEDHYFKCIQLCNQNKVNVKNAFKLQLIDYMKLIFTKQSKKTENLALMGFTLDASAKIYSYRVDKVYSDMMKVMSGKMFKETEEGGEEGAAEDGEGPVEGEDDDGATPKKKRRKNYDEEKELDFEKVLCSESDLQKNHNDGEGFLKERTTLPPHLEFFLECPLRNPSGLGCLNGPVFDSVEEEISSACISIGNVTEGVAAGLDASDWLPGYKEMHKRYCLLGGSEHAPIVNKTLAYDSTLQETVSGVRHVDDDDDMEVDGVEPLQMVDYDDGFSDDEPDLPSASIAHNTMNSTKNKTSFSIKGMSSMISLSENEYSYFDSSKLNFWAGPSHWSVRPRKRAVANAGDVVISRVSKKANFSIDFFEFDAEKMKKILSETVTSLSKKTLRTWSRDKNRNVNFSYTTRKLLSLFHDENLVYVNKDLSAHGLFSAAKSKLLDEDGEQLTPEAFNCHDDEPEVNMLDDHHADDQGDDFDHDRPSLSPLPEEPTDPGSTSNGLELIPAPPKVNRININFSKSQKRVDIKLLKSTIWKFMDLESNTKENIPDPSNHESQGKKSATPVKFSDVFSSLPGLLPPEEAAQLSCGIVFMAVLHMANEKTLALQGDKTHTDFQVDLG